MKAAVFYPEQRAIRIDERPVPAPGPDQLLIEVASVGICGSDLHYYRDGHIGDWWIRQPHVLGHEFSGVVVDAGGHAAGFAIGDRVAVEPIIPCNTCHPCTGGHYNLCADMRFTGSPHTDGALQEYLPVRAAAAHHLPEHMDVSLAALVEPTSVAVHAVRRSQLRPGESALVVGAGPIGLLVAAVAAAKGAEPLYVTDINAFRLGRALGVGATDTVDACADGVGLVSELTDGRGVDVVFEAVGLPGTIESALQMVRAGGRVVVVGVNPEEHVPVNMMLAQAKEATFTPVYLGRDAFPEAIELLATGRVRGDSLITHRFPLDRTDDAVRLASGGEVDAIKVVIDSERAAGA